MIVFVCVPYPEFSTISPCRSDHARETALEMRAHSLCLHREPVKKDSGQHYVSVYGSVCELSIQYTVMHVVPRPSKQHQNGGRDKILFLAGLSNRCIVYYYTVCTVDTLAVSGQLCSLNSLGPIAHICAHLFRTFGARSAYTRGMSPFPRCIFRCECSYSSL